MKKLFVGIMFLIMLAGCAGLNTSTATNIASDVAFTMVLQNNPSYKAPVASALQSIRDYLSGEVTYNDLIKMISDVLPDQYAVVAIILTGYIETDKPVFETYLPMFDSYKEGIIAKIDRFLLLTSV
jgi:hypothetical protein